MSNIFESLEGGAVSSALSDTPSEIPVVDTTAQGGAEDPGSHQTETDATALVDSGAVDEKVTDDKTTSPDGVSKEETEEAPVVEGVEEDSPASEAQEVVKGPKVLREFYESNKDLVEAYGPILKDREVSPELMEAGLKVFDNYLGLDGDADPEAVLAGLYELDNVGFNRTMQHFVQTNKDYIAKTLFGMEPKDIESFTKLRDAGQLPSAAAKDDIEVPDFDPETGEPLSEPMKEMMRSALQRAKDAEAQMADKAKKETDEQFVQTQAKIDENIASFRTERLKSVDNVINGLNLSVSPEDKDKPGVLGDIFGTGKALTFAEEKEMMASVIKGATIAAFGSDPTAQKFYRKAVEAIEESAGGKSKKAEGFAFNIERSMSTHAKKIAKFVTDLYARAGSAQRQQVQKAVEGAKKEVPNTGATAAGPASVGKSFEEAPAFDHASQMAELERILAKSGVR